MAAGRVGIDLRVNLQAFIPFRQSYKEVLVSEEFEVCPSGRAKYKGCSTAAVCFLTCDQACRHCIGDPFKLACMWPDQLRRQLFRLLLAFDNGFEDDRLFTPLTRKINAGGIVEYRAVSVMRSVAEEVAVSIYRRQCQPRSALQPQAQRRPRPLAAPLDLDEVAAIDYDKPSLG